MTAANLVRVSARDGAARIAMDAPSTRNALSDDMVGALIDALREAQNDDTVGCVVLASTHATTFSSGASLNAFAADRPLSDKHRSIGLLPELFTLIGELGKPVICEINGHCLAGALGLALACDLVVASETATFGTPEINVGVFPFMIAALIFRNVPRKQATQLLLLGDRIDAAEAHRLGIVNLVVAPDAVGETAGRWAARLAAKSPLLLRLGKDALWRQKDLPLEDAWDFLRGQLALAFATEDAAEGIAAFFEKREPRWTGR